MTGNIYQQQLAVLHDAIEGDEAFKVKDLARQGVDVNDTFDASINQSHAGITPLALACALNHINAVEALIDGGADVNKPFATLNTTALMTSSYHGHTSVVKLLLEAGADPGAIDLQQSTALGYAFGGTRNMDVIEQLLDAGIDVNRKNMLGMNALLLVAGYGNEDLVAMVLEAGAESNTSNDFGHSALHLAVVGKRDTLKKMRQLGTSEAAAADRSLNRRNLDLAMQEWARLHKEDIDGSPESQDALAKAGRFMMSLGHQLQEDSNDDEDDRDALRRRVAAVAMHRQKKIDAAKDNKKSGVWNLLSCGGGKAAKAQANKDDKSPSGAKPYSSPTRGQPPLDAMPPANDNDEITQVTESFVAILRTLIDAGCEIDKTEKTFGMTALDLAILNGDVESAAVLISRGGNPDHFPQMLSLKEMYQAIISKNRKDVKMLLQCDEDLNLNQPLSRFTVEEREDDDGMTLLAVAIRENDHEISKMIIKNADVDLAGSSGRPPIAEAANFGYRRGCELLLSYQVDIEQIAIAYKCATALTIAAVGKHDDIVTLLIRRGAKIDKRMNDEHDALLMAYKNDDRNMIEILLQSNLDTNFEYPDGYTYKIVKDYQSKSRDTQQILEDIQHQLNSLETRMIEEERIKAQRQAAQQQQPPLQQQQQGQRPSQVIRPAPRELVERKPSTEHHEEDYRESPGEKYQGEREPSVEEPTEGLRDTSVEDYRGQREPPQQPLRTAPPRPPRRDGTDGASIDGAEHVRNVQQPVSENLQEDIEDRSDEEHNQYQPNDSHISEQSQPSNHSEYSSQNTSHDRDDTYEGTGRVDVGPPPIPSVDTMPPVSDDESSHSDVEELSREDHHRIVTSSPRPQNVHDLADDVNNKVLITTIETSPISRVNPHQDSSLEDNEGGLSKDYQVRQEIKVVRQTGGRRNNEVVEQISPQPDEQQPAEQYRRSSYIATQEDDDLESITSSEESDYGEHDSSFHKNTDRDQRDQTQGVTIQRSSHNTTTSIETEI